ncbi:uncharacterized protein ARMOST_10594 [Armillaria ostoyae]|uniref:Uncharacterized protein n=1 Tax=Armillaria ostoyae TaxID=47428 RepID=A0A284REQ7_ARMOS|nr:uncharacterized protein ARMOST_10594 [Armillaria ostoyae]
MLPYCTVSLEAFMVLFQPPPRSLSHLITQALVTLAEPPDTFLSVLFSFSLTHFTNQSNI